MATFDLDEINLRTVRDPESFCEECEEAYNTQIRTAAEKIAENLRNCPIILLSGPSGSGKTTTARKLSEQLEKIGISTHYVSMDDYYLGLSDSTPRTPEGDYDFESPLCLDMELMNEHFEKLAKGARVFIPKYNFLTKIRASVPSKSIRLEKDEMCIFEGIHALNPIITEKNPTAFRLRVSADSSVAFKGTVVFKNTWFRLVRRTVRDYNFRGADAAETMGMWANVRKGEKLYITPYKSTANFSIDTAMASEAAVLNSTATKLFRTIPSGIECYEELRSVLPALQLFGEIDQSCVSEDSLLREFIGGGIYS